MFKRQYEPLSDPINFTVDGRKFSGFATDMVAAAMLANGVTVTRRTPTSGSLRAPYCMMGVCFECLVTIDGVGNRQACMVPLRDGMSIETGKDRREAGA